MNYSPEQHFEEDKEDTYIEVDVYGVKAPYTPGLSDGEETLTGKDVWESIKQSLLRVARDGVGLVADTFTSAREFVRGFGKLPPALASRVARAHRQADQSKALARPLAKEDAIENLEIKLRELRALGISAEIRELTDGSIAVLVTRPGLIDAGNAAAEEAIAKLAIAPVQKREKKQSRTNAKLVGKKLLNAKLDHEQLDFPLGLKPALVELGLKKVKDLTEVSYENFADLLERNARFPFELARFLHSKSLNFNTSAREAYYEVIRDQPIDRLELERRSLEACKRLGIETIDDLMQTPIGRVGALKGVGKKTVDRLLTAIQSVNLQVNESPDWEPLEEEEPLVSKTTPLFPGWET